MPALCLLPVEDEEMNNTTDQAAKLSQMMREASGKTLSLKQARGAMTQEQVARKAGMNPQFLAQIERGERGLTTDGAVRLAPALGMDAMELFARHNLAGLKEMADEGKVDADKLHNSIMNLAARDENVNDEFIDALLVVLDRALASQSDAGEGVSTKSGGAKGTSPSPGGQHANTTPRPERKKASTKSAGEADSGDRDGAGRQRAKPHDPRNFKQRRGM